MCGGFGRWEDTQDDVNDAVGRPESTPEVEQTPEQPVSDAPLGDDAADAVRRAEFFESRRAVFA